MFKITEARYGVLNLLSSLGPQVQNMTGQVYSGGQRLCHNAETPVLLHVMTVVYCLEPADQSLHSRQEMEDLSPLLENMSRLCPCLVCSHEKPFLYIFFKPNLFSFNIKLTNLI